MKNFITLILTLFFLNTPAFALNEIELVSNFETYPNSSYHGERLVVGDKLFFSNKDKDNGTELWILETPGGTPKLVKDINPGQDSSFPREFILFKDKLFFSARSSNAEDNELWYSDGTEAGTQPVGAIIPSAIPRDPDNLTTFGQNDERLAFSGRREGIGTEFCLTNGTANGTTCYNLKSGTDSSYPSSFIKLNDDLYFTATDDTHGQELWWMAYNAGAPSLFIDLVPGGTGSSPYYLTAIKSPLSTPAFVFSARTVSGEYEPFISYGFGGLTFQLKDINGNSSSSPTNFYPAPQGGAFFSARTEATGDELWYSDTTPGGTNLVKDITPGTESSYFYDFGTVGNTVLFAANSDGPNSEELWMSDGTGAGTKILKDIEPGIFGSNPEAFYSYGNKSFFVAETSDSGNELYVSDGTSNGTSLFVDAFSGTAGSFPNDFFMMGGQLGFFGNSDDGPAIIFLNATTGAISSTVPVELDSELGSFPEELAELPNGDVLVNLRNQEYGYEPYALNPTTGALTLLKDIHTGAGSSEASPIGTVNGKLVFSAFSKEHGEELWVTDGTPAGTTFLKDINPTMDEVNELSSEPYGLLEEPYNGYLYISAYTPNEGRELWRTDGTTAGTTLFMDIYPGQEGSNPSDAIVALGNMLFFQAEISANGVDEVFKTDGTVGNTTQLTDYDVSGVQYYSRMIEHDGMLFFGGEHPVLGRELYKSDGTPSGTVFAAEISPAGSFFSSQFYSYGGQLLMGGRSTEYGPAYFSITAPYTTTEVELLVDPYPGDASGGTGEFFMVYDQLFFKSITGDVGGSENTEPWVTDGTPGGTKIFKIIQPGSGATEMDSWVRAGDYYYFSATEGDATGNELWRSDGTPEGTKIFADLAPGKDESNPYLLGVYRGALYFTYDDIAINKELWRIVFDECPDDPNKLEFGECGCGLADIDSDGDGVLDCSDSCSADALKTTAGDCGCGIVDEDLDASGVSDCLTTEELRVRYDLLGKLITEYKKKPKKGRKKRKRDILKAYKDLNKYSRSQIGLFVNSTKKKTQKRLKILKRKVLKFRKKSNKKNRRKALKALARFLAISPL